ncbi:MAG: hypothetical protein A2X28_07955 [Elusimicrobia bacterium GWA2_56_46]|nr:MAG: hypothetical protein A2X28_07955 [Elusimicrobia bacterium GWA2_56_46]OGR54310.1 MAG: hypothetical protein A2X39_03755 [Elusimicrobia bacterium GWC2_56_31]HBB66547.1 hypothetical protein [Elusimicrobiota bacterium]HBW22403.1 hypothetical protein [Elusimicrobiota bacterium]
MKIPLALFCALTFAASPLRAQKAGDFGAGVVLGDPSGATAKLWLDDSRALDMGLGLDGDVTLYGDYLWHSWKVLPQPAKGRLPVYLGLGAQLGDDHHSGLGLRAVAGAAYWLPRDTVEIFLDIVPVFFLSHDDAAEVNVNIGLRYYFGR